MTQNVWRQYEKNLPQTCANKRRSSKESTILWKEIHHCSHFHG